jgi:hypothetical protein
LGAVLGGGGDESNSDSDGDEANINDIYLDWQGWRREDVEQSRQHGPHGARECEVTASVLGLPGISGSEANEIQDMPLHVFVRSGDSILFKNSLVHALLEHKWRSYAKGFFYRELFFYIFFLCNWAILALNLEWFHSQCRMEPTYPTANVTNATIVPTNTTIVPTNTTTVPTGSDHHVSGKIGVKIGVFFENFWSKVYIFEFRPEGIEDDVGRGRTATMLLVVCMLLVLCVRSMRCWWKRIQSRSSWSFVCEDDEDGTKDNAPGLLSVLGSFASRSTAKETHQKRKGSRSRPTISTTNKSRPATRTEDESTKDESGGAAAAMAAAAHAARKSNVLNRAREKFKSMTKQNRELTRQPSILVSKRHTEKQLAHASSVLTGHNGAGSTHDYGYVIWCPFFCCRRRCCRGMCCCGRRQRKGTGGAKSGGTVGTSNGARGSGMHIKLGMSSWWDVLDPMIAAFMTLSLYCIMRCYPSTRPLVAFTTILIVIKAFYFARGNDKLASLVRMVTQIASDMRPFMILFTIMWMSCSLAFFVLYEQTDEGEPPGWIDIGIDGLSYTINQDECTEDDNAIDLDSLFEAIVHTMNMAIGTIHYTPYTAHHEHGHRYYTLHTIHYTP